MERECSSQQTLSSPPTQLSDRREIDIETNISLTLVSPVNVLQYTD